MAVLNFVARGTLHGQCVTFNEVTAVFLTSQHEGQDDGKHAAAITAAFLIVTLSLLPFG